MPSVRYRTKGFEIRLRCEQRQDLVATRKKNRGAGIKMARHSRTMENSSGWLCQHVPACYLRKVDFAELTQESFAVPDCASHLASATLYSASRVSSRASA
jgi:hypothetical protein